VQSGHIALRHLLNLPFASVLPRLCQCAALLSAKPHSHLLTCKHQRGNGHIQRHDAVLKVIQTAINNAGGVAHVQVCHLPEDPADKRRPDLECVLGAFNILADVAILHPVVKSHLEEHDLMTKMGTDKMRKYSDLFGPGLPHNEFVPLIFEAYGGFSDQARGFLYRVATFAALSDCSTSFTAEWMVDRVATAIQRGNARTVLSSLRNAAINR
jgi:hypothetical protein